MSDQYGRGGDHGVRTVECPACGREIYPSHRPDHLQAGCGSVGVVDK